jgi:fumarylacetoacetate (FAA) hydrolase
MKLATLKDGGRDGTLVVVSRDLARCRAVPEIAATLQEALDDWARRAPQLEDVSQRLNAGEVEGTLPFDPGRSHAPLPRAFQWIDGSAYLNHVELVRRARGAELPASFQTDPLMYQGGSDGFLGPCDDIVGEPDWGIDLEAEIAAIVGDIPMGATVAEAAAEIRLLMVVNDVSLRNLIPAELAKGFGFVQSKPASAFSPVALTPDELGTAWRDTRVHLPLRVFLNDEPFGRPNAGVDATFDFAQLAAHVARTRAIGAGSIVGTGTVSNKQGGLWGSSIANGGVGYCCLVELRTYETIEQGQPATPYLQPGDRVRIEMLDDAGANLFGSIDQKVAAPSRRSVI